jgi:dipeptidyl aminopeptidase/acylaminoacyl peptidase
VVDWFGSTDFRHMGPRGDASTGPVAQLLGGPPNQEKEKAAQASPLAHVRKGDPPFLIMHGDKDPLVPLSQSEELADALKKAGVPVTLVTLKGAGHGGKEFGTEEVSKQIGDFFDRYLKGGDKKSADGKAKE